MGIIINRMESEFPFSQAKLLNIMQAHGVQPTPQRLEIAKFLFHRSQHVSAEQVFAAVNASTATVSKATVYNTLGLFVQKGLVRQVLIDRECTFYDSNTVAHYHIYNVDTGELQDLVATALHIEKMPQLPDCCELDSMDVVIRVRKRSST